MADRYTDWTHVRVNGDRHAAAPYVGEARKLLGEVFEEASRNGLGVHSLHRQLPDGTVLVAEKHGDIPRMTITPVVVTEETQPRGKGDFVIHARDTTHPDGYRPDKPQQLLQYVDGLWRTFTFAGDEGTAARSDGTYIDMFPDGLEQAGEIDWRGPNDERISWYGPSTRYWFDAWRQPSAQYGRFVFHLGVPLLDVDAYCAASEDDWDERLVLGAGIAVEEGTRWLYVMLADLPDQVTPQITVPASTVYISQNYPLESVPHHLRRVRLVRDSEAAGPQDRWTVATGSAESLWTGNLERACSPWVFNRQCSRATSFRQVESPVFVFSDDMSQDVALAPPAESTRMDIAIDAGAPATLSQTSVALAVGASEADVAVDYDADGVEIPIRIGRGPFGASDHAVFLVMGSARVPLFWQMAGLPAPFTTASAARRIVGCDAREGALLVDRRDWYANGAASPGAIRRVVSVEIVVGGALQAGQVLNDVTASGTGLARFDRDVGALESTAAHPVGPLTWLWTVSAQNSFFENRASFYGLTAACTVVPFHPADTFGQSRGTGPVSGLSNPVSGFTADRFYNNSTDTNGRRNATSFAVHDGVVVASMYDPRKSYSDLGGLSRNDSVGYATGGNLAELSGIGGTNARWHPCWVLGAPIGGNA